MNDYHALTTLKRLSERIEQSLNDVAGDNSVPVENYKEVLECRTAVRYVILKMKRGKNNHAPTRRNSTYTKISGSRPLNTCTNNTNVYNRPFYHTKTGDGKMAANSIHIYNKPFKTGRRVDEIGGKNLTECVKLFLKIYGFTNFYYTTKREK